MTKNVGGADKFVRLFVGLVLVVAGLVSPLETAGKVVLFVVAGIALATAFTGF
jgi:hypothetical protein